MKVVILRDVVNVGKTGEIKEVSDGFARNFLIPQGLAEAATPDSMHKLAQLSKEREEKNKKELVEAQKTAEQLEGRDVVIHSKAKGGKLFGSISSAQILQKLSQEGFNIKNSQINLQRPIKEVGEHPIKIKLGHGIEAEIKLVVVAE